VNYAFPIERPLPYGAWDTCHGPFVYGSTQIAQFSTRWVCWVGTNGMRFAKFTPGILFNDVDGQADDLFPLGTRPKHLSFSFEQDALHAIAIQTGTDTCAVRRKVSGVPTEYTFTGRSPVLFYNGIVEPDTAATDLMVFYIKAAGDKIYVRRQRDNFGIEYILNGTLRTTLRALQKTDAIRVNGVNRQYLWGIDTAGRQVLYISDGYPPFPQYAEDRLLQTIAFAEGTYFPTVLQFFAPGDSATVDVGFQQGEYISQIVERAVPFDFASVNVGLDTGDYRLVIVEATSPFDAASVAVGFESGDYLVVAIPSNAPGDAASVDVGFDSGVYTT
jgi:hypothetical protein